MSQGIGSLGSVNSQLMGMPSAGKIPQTFTVSFNPAIHQLLPPSAVQAGLKNYARLQANAPEGYLHALSVTQRKMDDYSAQLRASRRSLLDVFGRVPGPAPSQQQLLDLNESYAGVQHIANTYAVNFSSKAPLPAWRAG